MNEQCAHLAEGAELSGISKPAARVGFGRGSGIGNLAMRDIGEARVAEQRLPFLGAQQVRGRGKLLRPTDGECGFSR